MKKPFLIDGSKIAIDFTVAEPMFTTYGSPLHKQNPITFNVAENDPREFLRQHSQTWRSDLMSLDGWEFSFVSDEIVKIKNGRIDCKGHIVATRGQERRECDTKEFYDQTGPMFEGYE